MPAETPRRQGAPARPAVYAPSGMRLDHIDLKLLRLLQEGAREPIRTLAERVALSHNGTLNRLNRLEDSGAILRYMADIDEGMFDTWPYYWVALALTPAGRAGRSRLEAAINAAPEITQASELIGVFDLLLRAALQKPADWAYLQSRLDPSADLIQTAHLYPDRRVIKPVRPHPVFIRDGG